MLQAHEFRDVLHGVSIKVLASGNECKAMLFAIGTEVPFLHLFFRRVRFHALGQSTRVADALFEAAEVMIRGIKRMLRVSCLVVTPLDVARFLAVQETDNQLVNS